MGQRESFDSFHPSFCLSHLGVHLAYNTNTNCRLALSQEGRYVYTYLRVPNRAMYQNNLQGILKLLTLTCQDPLPPRIISSKNTGFHSKRIDQGTKAGREITIPAGVFCSALLRIGEAVRGPVHTWSHEHPA